MSGWALRRGNADDSADPRCGECKSALAVGPCAACELMICGDCGVLSADPVGTKVICLSCARLIAAVRTRQPKRQGSLVAVIAVLVAVAVAAATLSLAGGCSGAPTAAPAPLGDPRPGPPAAATKGPGNHRDDTAEPGADTSTDNETDNGTDNETDNGTDNGTDNETDTAAQPTSVLDPVRRLRVVEPPGGSPGLTGDYQVAARVFVFSDSQLHYLHGKRTFAQSPFAERMSFEVAVRPAALDDGSDLLMALFLAQYRHFYGTHSLVFLGDAADLSCTHELQAFGAVLERTGVDHVLAVTSNHDGFYAGNFTAPDDLDGNLQITDMPHDWTRACSLPGSMADHRLTKARAVAQLAALLPPGPPWATTVSWSGEGPADYRGAYLHYLRRLSGGDAGAPPVWGVFLDTVDYRGFAFESSQGAGSTGALAREQLLAVDRAMLEAKIAAGAEPVTFVVFGHHTFLSFEEQSRARLSRLLDAYPEIIAYVSAHAHAANERNITLPSGRTVPEITVGSTTDAPQSARAVEIHVDAQGQRRALRDRRLMLDTDALCRGVTPMAPDALGYTGYRIMRDGTPELNLDILDQLQFAVGLDDLAAQRIVQALGALLMENELVRAWAKLYADAPIAREPRDQAALDYIIGRRYAAADTVANLRPFLQGTAKTRPQSPYDKWYDPVLAEVLAVASAGVHRFGPYIDNANRLRRLRTATPEAHRYFLCHAVYAAAAEARMPRKEGNVLYIR